MASQVNLDLVPTLGPPFWCSWFQGAPVFLALIFTLSEVSLSLPYQGAWPPPNRGEVTQEA